MTAPDVTKKSALERIHDARSELIGLSHALHADPEIAFDEHRAAARVADLLTDAGFDVEVGVYGVPTALEAVYGTGDLTVTLCAEYDALPGIGHACGHNVIAAAGVGAAIGLSHVAEELGLRVKLLGTPAEEHGGGKIEMLTAGAWEDSALSLMVHPATGLDRPAGRVGTQAFDRFRASYTGRPAHAAAAPEHGINAGDAATVALVAIGLLRQQLPDGVRLNAFVARGGDVTNIIPAHSVVEIEVRSADLEELRDVKRKVLACIQAGAVATGCSVETERTEPCYAPLIQDPALAKYWDSNIAMSGRQFDDSPALAGGSTDMGNVSQVIPSLHPMIAIIGAGSPPHTAGFTDDAASPAADTAIMDAAAALTGTVIDVATDAELRAELVRRQAERPTGATTVLLDV